MAWDSDELGGEERVEREREGKKGEERGRGRRKGRENQKEGEGRERRGKRNKRRFMETEWNGASMHKIRPQRQHSLAFAFSRPVFMIGSWKK